MIKHTSAPNRFQSNFQANFRRCRKEIEPQANHSLSQFSTKRYKKKSINSKNSKKTAQFLPSTKTSISIPMPIPMSNAQSPSPCLMPIPKPNAHALLPIPMTNAHAHASLSMPEHLMPMPTSMSECQSPMPIAHRFLNCTFFGIIPTNSQNILFVNEAKLTYFPIIRFANAKSDLKILKFRNFFRN